MRITHFTDRIGKMAGGLRETVAGFCSELRQRGHEITVIAGDDDAPEAYEDYLAFNVSLLRRVGIGKATMLQGAYDALTVSKPDLVFQHGLWLPVYMTVTRYCVANDIPYIVVPHGMLDPYILRKNHYRKAVARFLYQDSNIRSAILLRALNEVEYSHIHRVYPETEVVIAPNGIRRDNLRNLGNKNRNSVLFLGRLDAKKGVLELLEAWVSLQQEGRLPNGALLTVAGWGSDRAYVEKVERVCRNWNSVQCIGPVFGTTKQQLYEAADSFILPSKGEGLPTTILEAWSYQCISLFSPECNFPTNIFAEAGINCGSSTLTIRQALLHYFGLEDTVRKHLVEAGLRAVEHYSWSACVDAVFRAPAIRARGLVSA